MQLKSDPPTPGDGTPERNGFADAELLQDLLELDKAIAASTEQIDALSRSPGAPPNRIAVETFVKLRHTLTEFREEILLLQSEPPAQKAGDRSIFSSLAVRVKRSATRGLKRVWWAAQEIGALQPAVRTARRLRHGAAAGAGPSPPDQRNLVTPPFSGLANEHLSLDHLTVVEQALHQMRFRMGDAWEGYIYRAADSVDSRKLDVKAIAFYIPRFYRAPEEDGSQKKDTNPWTNICEAMPRYLGHYQPRFPGELGFYDQRLPDVMRQQVDLARQYGIYGFCFQYYWSGGRQLLGQPLRTFLSDSTLDLSFCVCWMNWSDPQPRDASNADSTWATQESGENPVIASLGRLFSDPRYIRIDDKPVLVVRAPGAVPEIRRAASRWRQQVKQMGFPDVYLAGWAGGKEPADFNFDAAVEFPPDDFTGGEITSECELIDPDFRGHVYSYRNYLEQHTLQKQPSFVTFNTVMPSWDDESIRRGAGKSFAGATPALYARWLDRCCRSAMSRRPQERLVFIKAWNNWAEGAYLEPDRRFGYAYLQASANTLRRYQDSTATRSLIDRLNRNFAPSSKVAIIFHCHYEDLIDPIFRTYFSQLRDADLFVTVHPDIGNAAIERMYGQFPRLYFLCEENRGRDIRPFLITLRHIRSLGYATACKIHTKKTPQADNVFGESWRQRLIESLLGSENSIGRVVETFAAHRDVGLLAPPGSVMDLRLPAFHKPNRFWLDRLLHRLGRSDLIGSYAFGFPAGSMYWFRVEALAGLDDLILDEDAFEDELGQRDGTLAHAVERLVSLYAQHRGFLTQEIPADPGN